MKQEIDARFIDIGDLPTGFEPYDFKQLYLREFTLEELRLLHIGMHSRVKPMNHLIRAIQLCASEDINELTDGDFEFVCAWERMNSYPKAPLQVNWHCKQVNQVYKSDRTFVQGKPLNDVEMALKGVEWETCNTENLEIVNRYSTQLITLDDDKLKIADPEIDFPRVKTLADAHTYMLEHPEDKHMAYCARWVKQGKDFRAKFVYLRSRKDLDLYERILEAQQTYRHGITEVMHLRCRVCDYRWQHTTAPRLLSFFADNTQEDIFKIQYSMLAEFGMQPDMKMSAKQFLYTYSSLVKDKQEAAERKNGFKPLG